MRSSKEKLYDIIKRPIITEKSMIQTGNNKYTFEVAKGVKLKCVWNVMLTKIE